MNNLRVKILIDIDIIYSKKITINLQTRKLIINNCNIMTFITCTFIDFKINYIVKFYHVVIISTYTIITISFKIQNFELFNEISSYLTKNIIRFNHTLRYLILKQKTIL